ALKSPLRRRTDLDDGISNTVRLLRMHPLRQFTPSRDANTGQKYQRKVDIKSLDGNVVQFTMFEDLVKQFNKQEIDKLPHPIIIVASSCRVSKYKGGDVQLVATPATHYYINPRFREAADAYTMQVMSNISDFEKVV
nr:hypothetical protein [Tanacetum cinerariifolium]